MESKTRPSIAATGIATLLLLAMSCSENDAVKKPEVKDTEQPSVDVTKPSAEKLSSIATFTIEASDNQKVARIQVFVDGVLTDDQTFSTPTASIDFSWDTKNVADGTHQINVVITDAAGNAIEETFDVVVRNVLMKFHLQPNAITHTSYWAYVSNHTGEPIAVAQLKNDSEVTLYAPEGFDDETFSVTYFAYDSFNTDYPDEIHRGLITKLDQSPHEETFSAPIANLNVAGYITLHVRDVPDTYRYGYASGASAWYTYLDFSSGETLYYVPASQSTTDLLLSVSDDQGVSIKYLYLQNVASNASLDVSFSNFETYNTQYIALPPDYTYAYVTQFGVRTGADFYYLVNVGATFSQPIGYMRTVSPQEGMFDAYVVYLEESFDNVSYVNELHNQTLPQDIDKLDVNLDVYSVNDGNVSMSTTGSANTFYVGYEVASAPAIPYTFDSQYISGSVTPTISFKIPVIPQSLVDRYYSTGTIDFNVQSVSFYDRRDLGSGNYNDVAKQYYFALTGGRRNMHATDKSRNTPMRVMPFNSAGNPPRCFDHLRRPQK